MNDEVRPGDEPASALEDEAVTDAGSAVEAEEAAGEGAAAEDLAQALAAARGEAEQMRDAALRSQAEMENVRRRAARDVEAAHKFALEKFASGLLPIVDSLEKSVEAVADHEGGDDAIVAIKEGIALSGRLFADTLLKFGVETVDPLGESFDPERHEAVTMIDVPSAEPNSVVDVLQKGYVLNGRLIRAAMVVVAKGKTS